MADVNVSEQLAFDKIRIGLASPEKIRKWATRKVGDKGPTKDWECHCGKYKKIRYKGMVCDRCGVEVTKSSVRRERMGCVELATPVSHIWYFKGIPSRMGLILDISPRILEKVLYFA